MTVRQEMRARTQTPTRFCAEPGSVDALSHISDALRATIMDILNGQRLVDTDTPKSIDELAALAIDDRSTLFNLFDDITVRMRERYALLQQIKAMLVELKQNEPMLLNGFHLNKLHKLADKLRTELGERLAAVAVTSIGARSFGDEEVEDEPVVEPEIA